MIFRYIEEKDRSQLLSLQNDFHIKYHREQLLVNSPILPLIQYENSEISMKKALDELYDGSHICLLAEDKGGLVGFISGKINYINDKVHNKEGYVDDWFVKEEYRSKGVGKKLFELLLEDFRKQKCTHLAIDAYSENKKALKFYRKLGFHDFTTILKKKIDE